MPLVELEFSSRVAKLTLCRPEALNALNQALLREFEAALAQVRRSKETVVLVSQGRGRAFSAGSDLKELANCSPQQAAKLESEHGRIFAQLETLPQVTVAAWRGYVLGGGLFLGLYHDFRLASRQATIGLPEVAHGWTPPWGISRLVELVGWQTAKRLMMCGNQLDGAAAQQLGLVDEVWTEEDFDDQLCRWVGDLASRPVTALCETKALLHQMRAIDHSHWDKQSTEAFQRCYATEEAQRAVQRFIQRKSRQ